MSETYATASDEHEIAKSRVEEFRTAWPLLVIAFVGITVGISSTFFLSIGLFLKPISAEFGWGRGVISTAPLVITVVTALLSPVVGRLVDRLGAMPVALVSSAGLAVALLLLGTFTTGLWSFFGLILLLAVLGAGTIPLPFTKMVVANFIAARGLALGIALSGTGLGSALVAALLSRFIETEGWRAGYQMLAVAIFAGFCIMLIVTLVVRKRSTLLAAPATVAPTTLQGAEQSLVRDRAFLILATIFFLAAYGILTLVIHMVPMLTDAGTSLSAAGAIAGSIGLAIIAGRLLTGLFLDVVGAERLGALLFVCVALGMVMFLVGGTQVALPAAIIAGFGVGAEIDIMAFLAGRYFRLDRYGVVYGGLYAVFLVGSTIGPAVAGYVFDVFGNYDWALVGSASALVAAAILLLLLPKWVSPIQRSGRSADDRRPPISDMA